MSDVPEMVERLARAIAGVPTGFLDERWYRKARDGIAAMREPTEAMVNKATDCYFERPGADQGHYTVTVYLADSEAAEVWGTMIDTALR